MSREEALSKAINIVSYFEAHFAKSKEAREEAVNIIEALEQEPCEDCISREETRNLIRSLTKWYVRSEDGKYNNVGLLYDDVMFGIDRIQPKEKQEPKTGHWIVAKDCEGKTRKCTCDKCGYETGVYTWHNPNYCANCGAKMEVEE